jgi:hypothetical protein
MCFSSSTFRLVQRALSGPGGSLLDDLLPRPGERFIVKPRYSAFDHTPLELILSEVDCQRLVVAGMTTEGLRRSNGHRRACTALRYLVEVVGVGLDDTLDSWDAGSGCDHPAIEGV